MGLANARLSWTLMANRTFNIPKSKGKTFEVGVDARTGKVLENAGEGPNPD